MVMHARKTQRISDGYFEKHPTHPYQDDWNCAPARLQVNDSQPNAANSNLKYSSSRGSYGNNDRYSERPRDSPNGTSSYRSVSPDDSLHDRDRSYSKSSYLQKIREKEREKRDYQSSKYAGKPKCLRSPKDKRGRDLENRTNHDRCDDEKLSAKHNSASSQRDRKSQAHNCHDKRDDREKVVRVGDWSEHISSSGKKYYYNCKTEVSQWEKPREWVERMSRASGGASSVKDSRSDPKSQLHSLDRHSRSSNSSVINSNYRDASRECSKSSTSNTNHHKWNNDRGTERLNDRQSDRSDRGHERTSDRNSDRTSDRASERDDHASSSSSQHHHSSHYNHHHNSSDSRNNRRDGEHQQDMDISPGTVDADVAGGDSTPTTSESIEPKNVAASVTSNCVSNDTSAKKNDYVNSTGPILLATALPRLSSLSSAEAPYASGIFNNHVSNASSSTPSNLMSPNINSSSANNPSSSFSSNLINNNSNVLLTGISLPRMYSNSAATTDANSVTSDSINATTSCSATAMDVDVCPSEANATNHHVIATGSTTLVSEGPPTPTHSEGADAIIERKLSSPPSTLSSLNVLRPQGPSITPSLANHCRDDLTNHVKSWPSDIIEKQAQKFSEEAHVLGSVQCAKVSADLKIARAIVRSTEIQATLQEQRILFLRQQIKALEELKSQNSFMSDDA